MANSSDWRQALQVVLDPKAPAPENPLVRAIEEFAAELNKSPWVHASLRPGPVPQVKTLVTGPKTRRDGDTPMLSFWVQDGFVRVIGEGARELRSRDEVLEYLTDFATHSAFPETVAEYKGVCQSDTAGWFQADFGDDCYVILPPDSQRKLAEWVRGERDVPFDVDFRITGEDHPLSWKDAEAGSFVKGGAGRLESGGFEMRVMGVRPLGGGMYRAHGDAMR